MIALEVCVLTIWVKQTLDICRRNFWESFLCSQKKTQGEDNSGFYWVSCLNVTLELLQLSRSMDELTWGWNGSHPGRQSSRRWKEQAQWCCWASEFEWKMELPYTQTCLSEMFHSPLFRPLELRFSITCNWKGPVKIIIYHSILVLCKHLPLRYHTLLNSNGYQLWVLSLCSLGSLETPDNSTCMLLWW